MRKRIILYLTFLVLLVLFPFIYKPAKEIVLEISRPILGVASKTSFSLANFTRIIKSIKNLARENQELKEKINELEAEKARLAEIENENKILKQQLGFVKESKKLDLLGAQIIGQAPSPFSQYFILNKGESDGVKVDLPVICEGFLLGRIIEVTNTTSKVFLITNNTEKVPALLQESRSQGIVKGEIGYGLVVEDINKETEIKKDENVITSGLGEKYPSGLLIGKVDKVISKESDLFQRIALKTPIDFSKLEVVFILR